MAGNLGACGDTRGAAVAGMGMVKLGAARVLACASLPNLFNERPIMKLLFSVAALLPITAGSAIAQQKSEGTRESGALRPDNIVNLAAIEAVQKDLGVSPAVASKLTLLRDEYRAAVEKEYQDAGINPRDFTNSMTDEQRRKYAEIGRKLDDEFI